MVTKFPMKTKSPDTISSGKILTVVFSFSYSFLAITYESHTQFYTPPLVYSGITMYKEYETKKLLYSPIDLYVFHEQPVRLP